MRGRLPSALGLLLWALLAGGALAQTSTSNVEQELIRRDGTAKAEPAPEKATARQAKTTASGAARAKPTPGFDPARVVGALVLVVVLILLIRWGARRFFGAAGATRSSRIVQVLCRSPLTPRQQLVVLRVGRRLLVVADGGGQMNTLSEITDPDEVAALMGQVQDDHTARATRSFGKLFGNVRGKYEETTDEADREMQSSRFTDALEPDDGDGEGDGDNNVTDKVELTHGSTVEEDPAVASTRRELNGLMDKVRLMARQFKSP